MCGIFGYATKKPIPHLEAMTTLMALEMESRGRGSWGCSDGKRIEKGTGTISYNLNRLIWQDSGMLIGHTRQPTVGPLDYANAHPFCYRNKQLDKVVIGVHNGSIYNYGELNRKYGRNLTCDSMQIFYQLAAGKPIDELRGYGAVAFFFDGMLYLSKFNYGQLSVAQLKDGGILFASTDFAVEKGLKAFGIQYELKDIKDNKLYYYDPEDDCIYFSEEMFPIQGNRTERQDYHEGKKVEKKPPIVNNGNRLLPGYRVNADLDKAKILIRVTLDNPPRGQGEAEETAAAGSKEDH